jgi:hypothetical protein
MERVGRKSLRVRLTYANVMSTFAVFLALGGATAFAAGQIGKNSIGPRQLKSQSVTTGKLANNAVNGAKVANGSLSGADINLGALGTVPNATDAAHAANSDAVGGHGASCPANTTLIRGVCFDSVANPAVESPQEAADACAEKGGWLPAPLALYSIRGVLNLGTGVGSDHRFTDEFYGNTNASNYRSVVIDGNGTISEVSAEGHVPEQFICAYPLVR